MEGPPGYPPPTLVRKRSGIVRRWLPLLLLVVTATAGSLAVIRMTGGGARPAATEHTATIAPAKPNAAALSHVAAGEPPVTVETDAGAPAQPSPDAREPNRWYYVPVLADGPGAIYTRTGGSWNFAFACTTRTRTIEILAVGTGAPGDFDQQSIKAGKVKLMMDAAYSKDAGGTITTSLPAAHPFFTALDGKSPMEIRLVAGRKVLIPVGPDLLKLIRQCRGGN